MTTLPEALSALTRPADTACTLIENLLGEPFKVAGDVLADLVRFRQKQLFAVSFLRICGVANVALNEYLEIQNEAKREIIFD